MTTLLMQLNNKQNSQINKKPSKKLYLVLFFPSCHIVIGHVIGVYGGRAFVLQRYVAAVCIFDVRE